MFLFALKMCVADLKVILRKFWWLGLLFLAIIVFMPFHNMYMHTLLYFVMMTIGLFVPRYSKIQFILPVDEKQIKRFFLWRIVIVGAIMLGFALVVVGISIWRNYHWNPQGFQWVVSYMTCYLVYAEYGLCGAFENKKIIDKTRMVIAIFVAIISIVMCACAENSISLEWIVVSLLISFAPLIFAIVNAFWYFRNIKLDNYIYRPLGMWENGKKDVGE